jgi:hypothetical protein
MREWEYWKIDLSQQHPRGDELDLLNRAGEDGWELVGISSNNIAYLKRPLNEPAIGFGKSPDEEREKHEAKPKYRDPGTKETWSGRGRMANWLKRKQDAGEDIEKYRV